jgi:hypothetical protein
VVSVPGTAIRTLRAGRSDGIGRRATTIGPYLSPMLQPLGKQGVLVEQVGVGVDADGGDLKLAVEGAAVERLDVLQLVAKVAVPGVELVVGQGVEHEGVVGVRAVADADQLWRCGPMDRHSEVAAMELQSSADACASDARLLRSTSARLAPRGTEYLLRTVQLVSIRPSDMRWTVCDWRPNFMASA